ncbi:MAG: hypothetical protein B6U69_03240 [Thermofilum sp. ex4484_15]|nr:MAG: hypothetical protein B6U69_03240 [Thermofilum sp. ex4484_15]
MDPPSRTISVAIPRELDVNAIVSSPPEELPYPPPSLDHVDHVVFTALKGYPQLAADHLLHPEMRGKLMEVIRGIVRRLNFEFRRNYLSPDDDQVTLKKKILIRARAYEVLLEIAINLIGAERVKVGFGERETETCLKYIEETLKEWEGIEREENSDTPIVKAVINKIIKDMKKVMAGDPKGRVGMVAKMGQEIEAKLDENNLSSSFLKACKEVITGNVYYKMVLNGICKFGNDYAIGLRWLRHLGYVQVSTNPVLAAIAYRDDPSLWDKFKETVKMRKDLLKDPEANADELAMLATIIALWPNLEVFRPIAVISDQRDGMISYQLNPNVANSVEGSMKDALKIYHEVQEFMKKYDGYLLWGYRDVEDKGRPNIVFKVAGSSPAAIEITKKFNEIGIGTNNTITFSVSQEATLILAAMEGMAKAVRKGIKVTQVYETNMGGRLEDHLREVEAEKLTKEALRELGERELRELAEKLGALEEYEKAPSLDEKISVVCSRKYLRPITKEAFAEFLAKAGVRGNTKEEVMEYLKSLETDISYAGTFVAKRVYWIFFSPENRPKWLAYLIRKYGLTPEQAEDIMGKIDVLPASKRKPMDTYLTLARRNMTNTEFPNHQLAVLEESMKEGFNLADYEDAVLKPLNNEVLKRLMKLEDFKRAYELTPELIKTLREVGIEGDFGTGGLKPEEWGNFGPTVKTMTEFTKAYEEFKRKVVEKAKEVIS